MRRDFIVTSASGHLRGAVRRFLVVALLVAIVPGLALCAQQPPPPRPFRLAVKDASFWSLVPRDAKLQTMGTDRGFTEGPVWDKSGFLWVSDEIICRRGIWVWSPAGVHLGTIEVPEQSASLSWGGPDNSELFITGTTSVYRIKTAAHGFVPYE